MFSLAVVLKPVPFIVNSLPQNTYSGEVELIVGAAPPGGGGGGLSPLPPLPHAAVIVAITRQATAIGFIVDYFDGVAVLQSHTQFDPVPVSTRVACVPDWLTAVKQLRRPGAVERTDLRRGGDTRRHRQPPLGEAQGRRRLCAGGHALPRR